MAGRTGRALAGLVLCAALTAPASAQAGEVLVVGGGQAPQRVEDPFAPSRAETDLAAPAALRALGNRTRAAKASVARAAIRPRARASSARARRATARALRRALRRKAIGRPAHARYRRTVTRARTAHRRLRGSRRAELGNAIALVDGIALRGQLTPTRLPALMLTLRRNTQYWRKQPFPASGDHVTFRGSRMIFQYYPGNGLQLQPLVNFKQANLMHGACVKDSDEPCDRRGLRRLLAELNRTAARRGGFTTWEYYFEFGGGRPPWISGMAQATAIQALARASELLEAPGYLRRARAAFGAFVKAPPAGVRTTSPLGGIHYLQYSFSPGLYITNAFLQSLIGLYDYATITEDARARRLFEAAEPAARRELVAADTGDWSTYSYRGSESTREYHELLREFAASMCSRLRTKVYCDISRSFLSYMTDPADLALLGPRTVTRGRPANVRFSLSKLSAVQLTITRNGRVAFDRVATFRRGAHSFSWRPGAVGTFRVRLAAKELRTGRELRSYANGAIQSLPQ